MPGIDSSGTYIGDFPPNTTTLPYTPYPPSTAISLVNNAKSLTEIRYELIRELISYSEFRGNCPKKLINYADSLMEYIINGRQEEKS